MKRATVMFFLASLLTGSTRADIVIETHTVNTSVAVGSFYINGVLDHYAVSAGTDLSSELAHLIATTRGFDPALYPLEATFGTLNNLEFLTTSLTIYGNAGQIVLDQFVSEFNTINTALGGTGPVPFTSTYNASFPHTEFQSVGGIASYSGWWRYAGTQSYSLYGGFLDPTTIGTGTANVDFYEIYVDATVPQIVPVPGAVLPGMLGLGVTGLKLRKHA